MDLVFNCGSSCLRHWLRVLISLLCFLVSQVPGRGFSDDDCIDGRPNAEDTGTDSLLFCDLKMVLHLRLQINFWKGEGQRTKEMNHIWVGKKLPVLHERTMFPCGLDVMLLIIIFLYQSSYIVKLFCVMFRLLLPIVKQSVSWCTCSIFIFWVQMFLEPVFEEHGVLLCHI